MEIKLLTGSWDKEGTAAAVKEVRRNRLDPSVLLFDQISMPVISMPADVPVSVSSIFGSMFVFLLFVAYSDCCSDVSP